MLVLTRKPSEEIIIGDGIVVKIIGVDGDRVSVGIETPRSILVCLAEKFQQRMEQALADAKMPVGPLGGFRRLRAA